MDPGHIIFGKEQFFCILLFFICGSVFGSFFNCMAMRIVSEKDWIFSRSRCDHCNHELRSPDLIPVFSYILLRGHCRYCGERISVRHFLSEVFLGVVFVLVYLRYKRIEPGIFFDLSLFCVLFGLSLTDLDSYTIPDPFILSGLLNRFVKLFFVKEDILVHLLSAFAITLMVYMTAELMNKFTGRENFGGGDIKLLFMVSLYTSCFKGILILFLSCLFGLLTAMVMKKRKIPFGPCICMGTFIVLMYGDQILKWFWL